MTYQNAVKAKPFIDELVKVRFTNFKKMRQLVDISKEITSSVKFYHEEEYKIIKTYALIKDARIQTTEDGRLILKDAESKKKFEFDIATLGDTDCFDFEPLELSEEDFRSTDDYPTPEQMIALEGFIKFI